MCNPNIKTVFNEMIGKDLKVASIKRWFLMSLLIFFGHLEMNK